MRLNRFFFLFVFLFAQVGLAQSIEKGYYMFPIRPAQENYLAGTMGELRSTHFHTGIDIKTSGISGLSVYAAADGYLQRVKVSASGYGNAMYVVHPNGTTTVYAHLLRFKEDVANYVREQQYKKESFDVDINVPKGRFSFKKGDVIALSGNSGSSSGPHLHFEIRNAKQEVLNPLKYGFKEIIDNISPTLAQIAFVTLDEHSRVNGMFGRFEISVVEKDGKHELEVPVALFGRIGVEVYAYDKFNGANNRNGVVQQTLLFDNKPIFSQNIDKLSFSLSRNILVHNNYKRMMEGGRRFNKLYVDDGNFLKFYDGTIDRGVINILDPLEHSIDIRLEDNYGNVNQYHLDINNKGFDKGSLNKNMVALNKRGYDVRNNILEIMSDKTNEDCFVRLFVEGEEKLIAHSYKSQGRYFYLWDTKLGYPDSALLCQKKYAFNYKKTIAPQSISSYSDQHLDISFPAHALFDTLYLRYDKVLDLEKKAEYIRFDHYDQPLRKSVDVKIKPEFEYDQEHSFVYSMVGNNSLNFAGGKWVDGGISFRTRDLVKYTIATDTIPPEISHLKSKSKKLKFKIKDKKSGIGSFRGELDGKWILMNYDAKSGFLRSDPQLDISGDFVLIVKDNSGNTKEWTRKF